ncbi:hypothetical protein [Corallococcus exercitus]|uniref:Serine/threonine protein kinase n=1 Tax=Corallococcus exercitus TaxID=2316736 RepID=A0A7Y4JXH4_9BACT|nr:hypothetical protein [Corallococcus exercitus]NOK12935.1 hypothetical protein [Corallococcus exercitus]
MTTKPSVPPSPKTGRTLKAAAIASCVAGMACASAPLVDRPTPPAEDCPLDAQAAMQKLEVEGLQWSAMFDLKTRADGFVTVREGRAAVYTVGSGGRVQWGSMLTGTLYVGSKRVYGRFTQLRQKKTGETFPVCIELWFLEDSTRGVPRSEGGDENTAVVPNQMSVRGVWRYDE